MSWNCSTSDISPEALLLQESLYSLANGYIGVRGNLEEGIPEAEGSIRGTYVNAFYEVIDVHYGEKLYAFPETTEKLVNIMDTQTIKLYFGEEQEKFSLFEGEIVEIKRILHFDKGYSERIVHWKSPLGKEVKITFKRLVSLSYKELFIQRVEIEAVNFEGKVKIVSELNGNVSNYENKNDPRVGSGHGKLLSVIETQIEAETQAVICGTKVSDLKVACTSQHQVFQACRVKTEEEGGRLVSTYDMDLSKSLIFEKRNVITDTRRHGEKLSEAGKSLSEQLKSIDFETLLVEQESILKDFWNQADVQIEGDTRLQEGIRFNMYHLFQSAGRDPYSNIAAKGLSGEGYEGHYFWDTEIYMIPFFTLTEPTLAKSLLRYRYSILDRARERAKEMGHKKGALYPWRTIAGRECSTFFPAGSAQYHISADIAYSYIQYFLVTKDKSFWSEFGAEVLFETARIWIEVGHAKEGQFRIDAVTGPDEYTCIVNNNYYTNVMAKYNMAWAAKVYHLLKQVDSALLEGLSGKIGLTADEVEKWEWASQNMYLPYNEQLNINPQDDSFLQKEVWNFDETPADQYPLLLHYHPLTLYRYQVCKQADTILAHFLLEDEQEMETIRSSYFYYEKVTTHDSSLSSCIFSIMASRLGEKEKAFQYFMETARMDLDNTHGNTTDGLHMANMGGTWMAIVYGFGGLRIKEEGISLAPKLPDQWKGYSFNIHVAGTSFQVHVGVNEVTVKKLSGSELPLKIYNQTYMVSDRLSVPLRSY